MKKTIAMIIAIISIFIAIMASNNIVQASAETEEDKKREIVELKNEQVKEHHTDTQHRMGDNQVVDFNIGM